MDVLDRVAEWIPDSSNDAHVRPSNLDFTIAIIGAITAAALAPFTDSELHVSVPLVGGLVSALFLLWRQVAPLILLGGVIAVEAGTFAAARIDGATLEPTRVQNLALVIAVYTVARWSPAETVVLAGTAAVVAIPMIGLLNPGVGRQWAFGYLVTVAGFTVIGLYVRGALSARAERARSQQLQDRNRLANDIHDSVAHHMSAIALTAEAARNETDVTELHAALDAIHGSASTSLSDMRQLIYSLRGTPNPANPLAALDDLHALAGRTRDRSPAVHVSIDGDHERLPKTVSSAGYLIAREAVTNARRHAKNATRVNVHARLTDQFLDLTIHDDGAHIPTGPTPGHGTQAMLQRARELGGDLTAGPAPEQGWIVEARLPVNPARMP